MKRYNRIGICGTHGIGKTTLLNALRSEAIFKNHTVCNEVTRTVKDLGVNINTAGDDVTQRLIIQQHLVNIYMNEKMLTDRTAIDCLVYTKYLDRLYKIKPETLEYVRTLAYAMLHEYDLIINMRPEFPLEGDGVRSIDPNFQKAIDNMFIEFFKNDNNGYVKSKPYNIITVTGSVTNRVNQVLNYINND